MLLSAPADPRVGMDSAERLELKRINTANFLILLSLLLLGGLYIFDGFIIRAIWGIQPSCTCSAAAAAAVNATAEAAARGGGL